MNENGPSQKQSSSLTGSENAKVDFLLALLCWSTRVESIMSLKHPLSLVMPHSFHYIQQFVELSKFAWLFEKHSGLHLVLCLCFGNYPRMVLCNVMSLSRRLSKVGLRPASITCWPMMWMWSVCCTSRAGGPSEPLRWRCPGAASTKETALL